MNNKQENSNPVVEAELKVLDFWRQKKIFAKSVENRVGAEEFVFYEGPPTANAKAGIHHMIARAYKDVVIRFQTLNGKQVKRRAGWDTHGLPVEVQVEKALGLNSKKEIENLVSGDVKTSIKQFNEACRQNVWSNIKDWEEFTARMGYWLDFENPYITYESDYIEELWRVVKKIHEQKLLVKSHKVVPYCPRCGTPLSSHEVAQEYKDVVDQTVIGKFELTDEENTFVLAWTTTPWTLPGNIALAVGADIKYVKVEHEESHYILAKDLVESVFKGLEHNVVSEISVKDLVGKSYKPLFAVDELIKAQNVHQIIIAPFVTTEEGTGVVHTAAMYGVDDYEVAKEQNLPRIHTVSETGEFLPNVKDFSGQNVHEATSSIIDSLKESKLLFKQQQHKHSYPFCWRCKSKLIYYAKDSWFIEMSKLKDQLISNNSKINWIPAHLKDGRMGEWLREVRDWSFSRDRYWGTPLPVWTNKETGEHLVVGSIAELREMAKDKNKVPDNFDPHRPFVDDVILQDKKGRDYYFEGVICDVWFDSGAMPFASGEVAQGRYPADYISEAVDQTRGWFYTLQAVAVLMGETEPPYKNVISLGHINDDQGKKMSKSLGNIIDPMVTAEEFGMDAIRLFMYSMNQPGLTKRFSIKDLTTSYRKNQMLLMNVLNFYLTYRPEKFNYDAELQSAHELDVWVKSLTNKLAQEVKEYMNSYDITSASRLIIDYLQDLSSWYVRRSRERKTNEFFNTLHFVLQTYSIITAPFTPFLSEHVWQSLKTKMDAESVHLTNWPTDGEVSEKSLSKMQLVREIVEMVHVKRQEVKIKVRQPLSNLTINTNESFSTAEEEMILDEVNMKKIQVVPSSELSVSIDTTITPELQKEADVREVTRALQAGRKKAGLLPGQHAQLIVHNQSDFSEKEIKELAQGLDLDVSFNAETTSNKVVLSDNKSIFFEIK